MAIICAWYSAFWASHCVMGVPAVRHQRVNDAVIVFYCIVLNGKWLVKKDVEGGTRGVNRGWLSICIDGLRKITKNTQSGQWVFGKRLNPWPSENEAKVLHIRLWWCLLCFCGYISTHVQKILVDLWWHLKDCEVSYDHCSNASFQKLFPRVMITFEF